MQVFGISIANFNVKLYKKFLARLYFTFSLFTDLHHREGFCNRPGIIRFKLILRFVVPCVLTFKCYRLFALQLNLPSVQKTGQKRQSYNCDICTTHHSFSQRGIVYLCSAVMVSNQPSGNFFRVVGPAVLWVSYIVESLTSGSSEFGIRYTDRSDSWDCRSH